jgi:hypothetical protein
VCLSRYFLDISCLSIEQKIGELRLKIELTKGMQSIMKYKYPQEIVLL